MPRSKGKKEKKDDAFKTITIQNISDKTIEARAEKNKVTQTSSDTVQQGNKNKAGVTVKANIPNTGFGFSANASTDQSNKNVATKNQSVKDKLTFGWNKIPSGESIEFDFYNTKELFYVSIKGYVEDQAFNPNVNILIWNGKILKRAKELVIQQVKHVDQYGNPVQPPPSAPLHTRKYFEECDVSHMIDIIVDYILPTLNATHPLNKKKDKIIGFIRYNNIDGNKFLTMSPSFANQLGKNIDNSHASGKLSSLLKGFRFDKIKYQQPQQVTQPQVLIQQPQQVKYVDQYGNPIQTQQVIQHVQPPQVIQHVQQPQVIQPPQVTQQPQQAVVQPQKIILSIQQSPVPQKAQGTRTNTINKKNDLIDESDYVCAQIAWFTAGLGFVSFLICIIFGLIATIFVFPSKHSLKLVENIAYIINPIRKEFVVDDKPKKDWIDECGGYAPNVSLVMWVFPWAFIIIVVEFALALANIPAAMIGLPYALYHIKSIQFILFPGDKIVQNRKKIENLCLYGDACGC